MTDLSVTVADGIALLTLDRPERRNAYTASMGEQLSRAYRRCDDDDEVRAIVLTGAGETFCAGVDFAAPAHPFAAASDRAEFTASPIDPAAFELRTPVIAAVNGHAIGIGLTIALQADIRIMAADAKYAVAQVRRGVIPDCMSHWTLPHLVGGAVAAGLLLTGRTFDGAEAAAMGIATRTVPASDLLDHAMAVAAAIAVNVAPMSAGTEQATAVGHHDRRLPAARCRRPRDRVAPAGDGHRRCARGCRGVPRAPCAALEHVGVATVAAPARRGVRDDAAASG